MTIRQQGISPQSTCSDANGEQRDSGWATERRRDELERIFACPFRRPCHRADLAAGAIDQQGRRHARGAPDDLEVLEQLGAGVGVIGEPVDADYLKKAKKAEFVYDSAVLNAIEARLRDGLFTTTERDYFEKSAPQQIRERFGRIVPRKSTCPDEPWWAFWL